MAPAVIPEAKTDAPADEPWLRGNVRPVAVLAAICLGGLAAAAAVAWLAGGTRFLSALAGVAGLTVAGLGGMAVAASRPRLVRRGDALLVRLHPVRASTVPLEAVECFFPGSSPLDRRGQPTCGDHASWRVSTLVMRLAERAVEQRTRRTFTPWGTWDDGYVVFDGRWCEPLSAELARGIGQRLIVAKREIATRQGGHP